MTTVLYLLIVLFTVIQSASTKRYAAFSSSSLNFNIIKAFAATAGMALLAVGKIQLDSFTAIIGCIYGIMLSISMHFGFLALSCGPLALTSMLVSLSVIIPVLYGVIFCNEPMTATKLMGLILLCVTLVVSRMGKQEKSKGVSTKWALYVLLTFVTNGACSVLQKVYQTYSAVKGTEEFMLYAMATAFAVFLITGVAKKEVKGILKGKSKYFALLSGIANGLMNYFTLLLTGYDDASVLFPIISVGTVFGSLICGLLFFKEKPKPIWLALLALGVTAVVLLKI